MGKKDYSSNQNNRGSNSSNSGRGSNRSNGKQEIKFTPFYAGKQQGATYDTVRDHLFLQMQKTFRNGNDIVQALQDDTDDFGTQEPTR